MIIIIEWTELVVRSLGVGCVGVSVFSAAKIGIEYYKNLLLAKDTAILLGERLDMLEEKMIPGNIKLRETQLILGYEEIGLTRWPIIVDMEVTPHLFVCGLSGNGKTRMIEYAISGKDCILLNVDRRRDFLSIDHTTRRINGKENILNYLNTILNDIFHRDSPFFIVIDELLVLCKDKKLESAISDLLAIGRHYNIYLIGISQLGVKEAVKFKDLFNARVCFRMVEDAAYRAVLGYTPENRDIQKRQFFYYSNELGTGFTYDIRPDEK